MGPDHIIRIEHQLAIAQQITHIGSWEWDPKAGAVTWSDELYRVYGFEPRSRPITLEFFLSRVLPDDRAMVQSGVAEALARGGRFAWRERIIRADGAIRELDTIGEALVGDEKAVSVLIGTCRDVTDERERDRQIRLYVDIVRNVQTGLSVWSPAEGEGADGALRLAAFNPASERLAGTPLTPLIGKRFDEVAPYAAGGEIETLLTSVGRDRLVREAGIAHAKAPGTPARALSIKGFPLDGTSVGLAIEDVTTQTIERQLQSAENHVLELIASGAPLPDALTALVLAIEEHSPPCIGSILLLDPDGLHVHHGAGPHLPDALRRAIDGAAIGPHAGACGTAAFVKKPVLADDIETDPHWEDYRAIALSAGLRACWSVPIIATDERVLGTFAFYYKMPRTPSTDDLALATRAARLAGIAIERKALEQQLRDLSAHLEATREDERTGIAREIHDELGQALTALKMDIAWILRRAGGDALSLTRAMLVEKLTAMSSLTDGVIQQVRRISAELRPGVLDDLGLVAAIDWQAQEFEGRTGTTCVVRASPGDIAVDRPLATAVFRIFQEALTNVSRHAQAQHVEVRIDLHDGTLALEVSDDGVGISPEAVQSPRSLGLLGLRERAHRFGGYVAVEPVMPRGTRVALRVPLNKKRSR